MNNSILIVEDEPKLARLLTNYLRQAGYEPQCLENGLDVVPQVREKMPALILLDLMLPGRNGKKTYSYKSYLINLNRG